MARPTINELKRRKGLLEQAVKAGSLETFRACIESIQTESDLLALKEKLKKRFDPKYLGYRIRAEAIDEEIQRRENP